MTRIWLAPLSLVGMLTAFSFLTAPKGVEQRSKDAPGVATRTVVYYRDPMHPSYTSDKPGKAPDCGMDLEPIYAEPIESNRSAAGMRSPDVLHVDPERQRMIGMRLGRAEQSPRSLTLRTVGRVVLDEDRVFPVATGSEGWVTRVFRGTTTGQTVRKGQPLASVYGREYITAQRTFLYALRASENPPPVFSGDPQDRPDQTMQEALAVLRNLGVGEGQIQELIKTRQVMLDITLTAPATGVIVARDVFKTQKFDRGAELFRIADLSRVWIDAYVSGDDTQYFRSGATAVVSMPHRSSTVFRGTVSGAAPRFNGDSRALTWRLDIENHGAILQPDMFVDVEFPIIIPDAITVPVDAVVDSGLRKTIFVEKGEGVFESRVVETGRSSEGRVQIISGVQPGESIVVAGAFLLDSESRLRQGDAVKHD